MKVTIPVNNCCGLSFDSPGCDAEPRIVWVGKRTSLICRIECPSCGNWIQQSGEPTESTVLCHAVMAWNINNPTQEEAIFAGRRGERVIRA